MSLLWTTSTRLLRAFFPSPFSCKTNAGFLVCAALARAGERMNFAACLRLYGSVRHVRESLPMPASVPEAIRAHREQILYLVVGAWNTLFQYVSFSVLYYFLHDQLFSSLILLLLLRDLLGQRLPRLSLHRLQVKGPTASPVPQVPGSSIFP